MIFNFSLGVFLIATTILLLILSFELEGKIKNLNNHITLIWIPIFISFLITIIFALGYTVNYIFSLN